MLTRAGVTTHLATDHMHYWEDGGATYHTRYGTCTLVRGQQGDPWKGRVADPEPADDLRVQRRGTWRQDRVNRQYLHDLADHPQTRTFDAGIEFMRDNADDQRWFVQIETFDPHEPFFSDPAFLSLYGGADEALPAYDWPDYMQVVEDEAVQEQVRRHYSALVSLCDASLGRVLDAMDELRLWDDTMLLVCTDHGFLLGEQGWWGKSVPPWYDETIHTPLFIRDPRAPGEGEHRRALVQTIDIGPTLLDWFGVSASPDMEGVPLGGAVESDRPVREFGLFGGFGGHVSVTDGRYVYMRASVRPDNSPLFEHTLMPTHMRGPFTSGELAQAELAGPFPFSKGMPLLRTPGHPMTNPYRFGTLLFDLEADPQQATPLVDDAVELRMADALVQLMRRNHAPQSQFVRLGLPASGAVGPEHLLCRAQLDQARRANDPPPALDSFPTGELGVHRTLGDLLADERSAAVLRKHLGRLLAGPGLAMVSQVSLYRAAVASLGIIPWETLREVAAELAQIGPGPGQDRPDGPGSGAPGG
jgi:arylsulfatase A-like enzyme